MEELKNKIEELDGRKYDLWELLRHFADKEIEVILND